MIIKKELVAASEIIGEFSNNFDFRSLDIKKHKINRDNWTALCN